MTVDNTNSKYTIENCDTAIGFPAYYENACVGKAVYGINL